MKLTKWTIRVLVAAAAIADLGIIAVSAARPIPVVPLLAWIEVLRSAGEVAIYAIPLAFVGDLGLAINRGRSNPPVPLRTPTVPKPLPEQPQ